LLLLPGFRASELAFTPCLEHGYVVFIYEKAILLYGELFSHEGALQELAGSVIFARRQPCARMTRRNSMACTGMDDIAALVASGVISH